MSSVLDLMFSSEKLKFVADGIKSAGILDILEGEGPFTVFAPTDPAVAHAAAGKFKTIQKDNDKFRNLAKCHIVRGYYPTNVIIESLKKSDCLELTAVCGEKLTLKSSGFFRTHIWINGATIVTGDLLADNGVVHTIDAVLFLHQ